MEQCIDMLHKRYCGQWQETATYLQGGEDEDGAGTGVDLYALPLPAPGVWCLQALQPDGRGVYGQVP